MGLALSKLEGVEQRREIRHWNDVLCVYVKPFLDTLFGRV